ncbi:hypothetical protein P7K49_036366 [Saguinus oedipus]|uniref:Uncharacterized protein n=1 Tax=Saguinus oedipus TaxID=9490 RepID=A0ABQ9TJY4_SAGOE|nr:hypothetical protein P7K49_036366 [Saguinus oedipus]
MSPPPPPTHQCPSEDPWDGVKEWPDSRTQPGVQEERREWAALQERSTVALQRHPQRSAAAAARPGCLLRAPWLPCGHCGRRTPGSQVLPSEEIPRDLSQQSADARDPRVSRPNLRDPESRPRGGATRSSRGPGGCRKAPRSRP